MKVEFKLYKTFDADLISLHDNGIDIREMMKLSLAYFSKGKVLYFVVPECRPYNMIGHKRFIHLAMNVTDEESVKFLKTQIKPRQRSAFLKSIVRAGIVSPQVGPYLKHSARINEENNRLKELIDTEPEYLENFTILEFEENFVRRSRKAKDYLKSSDGEDIGILLPEEDNDKPLDDPKSSRQYSNQFGDVSDLSIKKDIKEEFEETTTSVFDDDFIENLGSDLETNTEETNTEEKIEKNMNNTNEEKNNDNGDDPFSAFSGLLGGH